MLILTNWPPSHSASLISAITPCSGIFCCHSFVNNSIIVTLIVAMTFFWVREPPPHYDWVVVLCTFEDYYRRQAPLLSKWHFITCMITINGQKCFASACCGVSGENIIAISIQCTQTIHILLMKVMKTNKHPSYFYQ